MSRLLVLTLLTACARTAVETPGRPLTSYRELEQVRGPNLSPVGPLEAWLAAAGDTVLRLPVTFLEDSARLGDLPLTLDDSALGISLVEQVQRTCPGGRPCTVWLEGRWRAGTIQVIHVSRAVAAGEVADFVSRER